MITASVQSLNIGRPKEETFAGRKIITGIGKEAVTSPLFLGRTGFNGDDVHNKKYHGGPDKAVCFYSYDHYDFWARLLGHPMPPAAFGENITVTGLSEDIVAIGDIYHLGSALVQISQPRRPCHTLAARHQRADLVKLVIKHGFSGWYGRVVEEGEVGPGSRISLFQADPHHVTIRMANTIFYHDKDNLPELEKLVALAGLSSSWRRTLLARMTALNKGRSRPT
ncbi:MAG: MOSC domain-containing protein [Desulfobulbaceae bacterium]|nr:MAG: MOSC domain-containing protein [Desulfobulbaceae bacterium]